MRVSVGIKALNEEKRIAAAIASALDAVRPFDGDVVLADSGSTDRTVEIARGFPIRIVQIANPGERSCGAGAQLAFQAGGGDYFYLLDGDMVLHPEFIARGVGYLESHPDFAAVGGLVREVNLDGPEFQIRSSTVAAGRNWLPGVVDRLDCGGLYRASAVREVGYFADRNLHAFEELDLGVRLQSAGWKLARIDVPAVEHFGHVTGGYRLLLRRMQSGYSTGSGQVLRAAIGRPHMGLLLRRFSHLRHGAAVVLWWLCLIAALAAAPFSTIGRIALVLLLVLPVAALSIRRRSLRLGIYSLVAWNFSAVGMLRGLLRRRVPPEHPIESVILAPEPVGARS